MQKTTRKIYKKWNNKDVTAPVPENEAQRLEWLRRSAILDTLPEAMFDEAAQLAAKLCQVPTTAVNLADAGRH